MRYFFNDWTSFSASDDLEIFCALVDFISKNSGRSRVRMFRGAKWNVIKGSVLPRVREQAWRFNSLIGTMEGFVCDQFHATNVKIVLQPSATAVFWEPIPREAANVALSEGNVEGWQMLIPVSGIQALGGKEPSVCSLSFKMRKEMGFEAGERFLVAMIERCFAEVSRVPEDLRGYVALGKEEWSNGGMSIVLRSRTNVPRYELWPSRFLQPKHWLIARQSTLQPIASGLELCAKSLPGSAGLSSEPLGILRLGKLAGKAAFLEERLSAEFLHFRDPHMPIAKR